MIKIGMHFKDGTNGLRMRPEFRGKSTMELILAGKRTATSRDFTKPYNRNVPPIGAKVIFYDREGRKALCTVTSNPKAIKNISPEEWSKKEGWAPEAHQKLVSSEDYYQFEFQSEKAL